MIVAILYDYRDLGAAMVEFDAVLSEGHAATAEATRHPVERGADVSDHIVPHPRTLDLVGVVSDFPIVPLSEDAPGWGRIKEREERLRSWERQRRLAGLLGPARLLVPSPEEPSLPEIPNEFDGRSAAAWAVLDQLRSLGQLVTVTTKIASYPMMAITSIGTTRDASSSDSLSIRVSLEEVQMVASQEAEIPPELLAPRNQGKQTARPADAATEEKARDVRNRSALHRLGGAAGVF